MSSNARSAAFSSIACSRALEKLRFELSFGHRKFRAAFGVLRFARVRVWPFFKRIVTRHGLPAASVFFRLLSRFIFTRSASFRTFGSRTALSVKVSMPDFAVDDRARDQIRHAKFSLNAGLRHAKDNALERMLDHVDIDADSIISGVRPCLALNSRIESIT